MRSVPVPGPWVVSKLNALIVSADRGNHECPVAFVYGPAFADQSEIGRRALASARLIAAAPDMLKALKALHERYVFAIGNEGPEALAARAAIAKAEGQS